MDANLFVEGSIYYYENTTNTKEDYFNQELNHDFIVSRPVYILDSIPLPFNIYTINVLIITSSPNRAGIPINISGYRNGKIMPYRICSVHTEYLTNYIGQVSDEKKAEVRQAIQYHLNFSNEIPNYIKEYKNFKEKRDKYAESVTKKERCVLEVIESCKFCDSYWVSLEDFLFYYRNEIDEPFQYEKSCNVTKAIRKLSEIYPSISLEERNKEIYITGCCPESELNSGKTSYNYRSVCGVNVRSVPSENDNKYSTLENMTREELMREIGSRQKKIYFNMNLISKVDFMCKKGLGCAATDQYNFAVMKTLIKRDIKEKEDLIKSELLKGKSPYTMSHPYQYIIYHMDDVELERCVRRKIAQRGIKELKKSIRQQINYLFRGKKK